MRTWRAARAQSEETATEASPMSRHARMIRTAISPRLAMRILFNGSSGEPVAGPDRLCILAFDLSLGLNAQAQVVDRPNTVGLYIGSRSSGHSGFQTVR